MQILRCSRRPLAAICFVFSTVAPACLHAQSTAKPPAYTPVRWNEDYNYLRDPANRTDWLDPLKFIPLDPDENAYLTLGGQARYRYEFFNDNTFGAGPQDENGFHLLRMMAHADLHLGDHLRGFVQIKSALTDGRDGGPRGPDADEFDLEQAFADVLLPLDDEQRQHLLLRGGRQNLLYGAQRLISPLDWTNARRTFEGARASWASPDNTLDLFWVRPVLVEKEEPNWGDGDTSFAGVYDTLALPDLLEGANTNLEIYGLILNRSRTSFAAEGTGDEDRYTVGGRLFGNPRPFDFDIEAAYQFGNFGEGDVSAYMLAAEAGYTFAEVSLKPRIYLGFDVASGDDDPGDGDLETFNQLFPLGHAYFGYIDVIGRQNIIDVHPGVELLLLENRPSAKKVTLRADYHVFWRQSDDDALYNAAGAVQRADGGSDERFVGSEIDLYLSWQIERHWSAYFGYSHFFSGDFIEETGPAEDIDFVYAAVLFTF